MDSRATSPTEAQLIDMFDDLPKEFKSFLKADANLYKNFYTINYDSSGKFDLKSLVSKGTITMKEEFKVNNLTLTPSFFNIGPLTF